MKSFFSFLFLTFVLGCPTRSLAMTNSFTYQGRLSDGGIPVNDVFSMFFVLHDHPTDGDGIGVTVLPEVPITNGVFTAMLTFPETHWNGEDRWVAILLRRAAETNAPFTELAPRQLLTPIPYALLANTVPNGAIQSQHIAPGAVGTEQLAANAVTGSIAPGSITGEMLAEGSVNNSHLAPGTAAANLADQGQSAIGSGGMVLSESGNNTNLTGAGYVKIGKVELVPESLKELAEPPIYAGSLLRVGHSTIWTGTEYIIWGGKSPNSYTLYNDGARYNPTTDTWTYLSASNAPSARSDHEAFWTGSEMIIWGGNGAELADRGARYNPATGEWTLITTNNAPAYRKDATVAWAGTHLVVWGGYTVLEDENDNEFHIYSSAGLRYNPANNTWSSLPTSGAPSPRAHATATWTGSELIVWGGYDASSVNPDGYAGRNGLHTGSRYHLANNTWTPMGTNNAPLGRDNHSAVWTGTELIVWGGTVYDWDYRCPGWPYPCYYYNEPLLQNTGGRYNPANNTWTPMTTVNAPLRRNGHSALWTGSRLVIWGGQVYGPTFPNDIYSRETVNTGGIYNPGTDSWIETATFNAPEPSRDHTGIWTGSRMLVWGSIYLHGSYAESSGRFDPVANSWSEMAVTGDVVKRTRHTSVWTGDELLIWGGRDVNGNAMRSGLRYNPLENKWRFMSLANAPSPRHGALSAWTGTEMIVWGGEETDGTDLRTGGRYHPANDSWIPLPTENSPSQRTNGVAVWAGGHFIVWGGKIGSFLTSTGGRFNPATGQWQATALPPAGFLPRQYHSATAIGDAMIVWGGINGTNYLGDGAIYRPATDTWTLLPQIDAPTPRAYHTAVWSGTELIIFGGSDATRTLRTGGRLNPSTGVWTPTTAADATQAGRSGHRAVWAYDRMIVVQYRALMHSPQTDSWTQGTIDIDPKSADAHWTGTEALWWTGDGGCQSYSPARTTYLYLRP